MSTEVKHRRGTSTEHKTFTGAMGEITLDTTDNTLVSHNGADAGGFKHIKEISAIARSLNVKDAQVIYHDDTNTVLDNVLYIYDKSANQTVYIKPFYVGTGETIDFVAGGILTTNVTSYPMRPTLGSEFEADPMKYGAYGDGEIDDTAAVLHCLSIHNAINLKSNRYAVDASILSQLQGFAIYGNGSSNCGFVQLSDYGNVIDLADPSGPMRGASLKGFSITPHSSVASVTGTAMKMDGVRNFVIDDVIVDDGYLGLHMLGCSQGVVDKLLCIYETNNGGVNAGRKYILIEDTANANIVSKHPGDLFISNFNGRCGGTPYCETGVEIHSADGIWFNNYHIGNCTQENLMINADRVARCTGIKMSNGWHDIGNGSAVTIKGDTPSIIGNYSFNSVKCLGGNTGFRGYDVDGSAVDIVVSGADSEITGYGREAVRLAVGFTGTFSLDAKIHNCALLTPGTYDAVKDESIGEFTFAGGEVESPSARWLINAQQGKAVLDIANVAILGTGISGKVTYIKNAGCRVEGNKGFNPVGNQSLPVGASPWLYTNDNGYPVQVIVYGGTGVSIVYHNTPLTGREEGDFIIGRGQTLEITYTTTPFVYILGL